MKQALWYLLSDFLSAILFLIVYAVSGSARLAAVAVSAGSFISSGSKYRSPGRADAVGEPRPCCSCRRRDDPDANPRFVVVKPSIVHFAVAAARLDDPLYNANRQAECVAAGYAWAVLMATLGLINLVIALYFDFAT